MATPEHILSKIKFLHNLGTSSNGNEATTAIAMADKLIIKYQVSLEELKSLEEQPAKYGEDDLLFHTIRIVNWMQHLSLACAKHFFCYIVQETVKPGSGDEQYNYYVYGDDEDVNYVKFAFHTFHKKINELIAKKCVARGPIYIESYCEGVIEAVKYNLSMDGLEMPEVKKPVVNDDIGEKVLNTGHETLATVRPEPEKPEKETVDISKGTLIKDVAAYFKGVADGKNLSLQEILELEAENERVKELQRAQEETGRVSEVQKEE